MAVRNYELSFERKSFSFDLRIIKKIDNQSILDDSRTRKN